MLSLGPSLAQGESQFEGAQALARHHFVQSLELATEQHTAKLRMKARHFTEASRVDLKLHVLRSAHIMDIARRESVRDVWRARNDTAQTLMIVESVFLAFVFEIIVGARIPDDSNPRVLAAFSFFLGASLLLSVLGIVLLLAQHHRLAQYQFSRPMAQYSCGRSHPDLNDYFRCHCSAIDNAGKISFTASVIMALMSCCIYGTSKWASRFDGDTVPGILFSIPIGFTILFLLLSRFIAPDSTAAVGRPAKSAAGGGGEGTGVSFSEPHDAAAGEAEEIAKSANDDFGSLAAETNEAGAFLAGTTRLRPVRRRRRRSDATSADGSMPPAIRLNNVEIAYVDPSEGESSDEDEPASSPPAVRSPMPASSGSRSPLPSAVHVVVPPDAAAQRMTSRGPSPDNLAHDFIGRPSSRLNGDGFAHGSVFARRTQFENALLDGDADHDAYDLAALNDIRAASGDDSSGSDFDVSSHASQRSRKGTAAAAAETHSGAYRTMTEEMRVLSEANVVDLEPFDPATRQSASSFRKSPMRARHRSPNRFQSEEAPHQSAAVARQSSQPALDSSVVKGSSSMRFMNALQTLEADEVESVDGMPTPDEHQDDLLRTPQATRHTTDPASHAPFADTPAPHVATAAVPVADDSGSDSGFYTPRSTDDQSASPERDQGRRCDRHAPF